MSAPLVVQITAASLPRAELLARIRRGGSAMVVQLRDPELDARALLALARELRQVTREIGARLVVNDRLDVARLVRADGVHLGRTSVSPAEARAFSGCAWISCSAHSVEEAVAIEAANAVLLSPIFETPGKGAPLGLDAIAEVRRGLAPEVALIALGGIDVERARQALSAGADGVAAIRSDLSAISLSAAG